MKGFQHASRIMPAAVLIGCSTAAGLAQPTDGAFPTRPVRLIVPFAPGGGADATARLIAPKLTELMGQNWVADNRPGAGGNLSSEIAVRANPDGYTVLLAIDSQLTANPSLYDLSFDVTKDLQPVVLVCETDQIIVVHPGVTAKTLKDLVALAKARPGTIKFGSGGVGSSNHLAGELVKKVTGIDIVHVPYKGAGPSIAGILAGEIQMNISSPASTVGFITSGKLRAIARTGTKRGKVLPDLPTVAESGYPRFEAVQWYGLVVPGATPSAVVTRIRSAMLKGLQDPDLQASMERLGFEPGGMSGLELAARIKEESAKWAAVIKEAGIRLR